MIHNLRTLGTIPMAGIHVYTRSPTIINKGNNFLHFFIHGCLLFWRVYWEVVGTFRMGDIDNVTF